MIFFSSGFLISWSIIGFKLLKGYKLQSLLVVSPASDSKIRGVMRILGRLANIICSYTTIKGSKTAIDLSTWPSSLLKLARWIAWFYLPLWPSSHRLARTEHPLPLPSFCRMGVALTRVSPTYLDLRGSGSSPVLLSTLP